MCRRRNCLRRGPRSCHWRYEEMRILAFAGGYFQPNADDWAVLNELDREHPLVLIGGYHRPPLNAGDLICRNPECRFFNRRVWVEQIASIPAVPINGVTDFWFEYDSIDFEFYFWLCENCGTIISLNVAS